VVLGGASLVDELGGDRTSFGLSDVMGVELVERLDQGTFYVRLDDPDLGHELPDIPLMMRGSALACRLTSATPLARFVPQMAPRTRDEYVWPTAYNPPGAESQTPAITVNHYGRGTCYYVAFPLAVNAIRRASLDPTPRRLLANLVRKATARPFLRTNAPMLVEAVANRTPDGGATVHLINWYAGVDGNYSSNLALPGIADLYLDLDASRLPGSCAVVDGDGKPLPFRTDSEPGSLRVDVPVLRDHVAVQIRATH
jgi:hypothetical protein